MPRTRLLDNALGIGLFAGIVLSLTCYLFHSSIGGCKHLPGQHCTNVITGMWLGIVFTIGFFCAICVVEAAKLRAWKQRKRDE